MSFKLWLWSLLTGSKFKATLLEGERLIKEGRNVEALEVFRAVVKDRPTLPDGYHGLSRAYQAMGLRLEAGREATIADSLELLQHNPDDIEARLDLAEAFFDKDMFGWAASHIEHALKQKAVKNEVLLLASRIYRANRNYEKAAAVLRKALTREPMNGELHEKLAFTLRSANHTTEAVKAATIAKSLKTVQANPGDAALLDQAVRQLFSSGQKNMAHALVEDAVQANPGNAGIQRLYGEMQVAKRKPNEAVIALRKAVALDPSDMRAHRLLGGLYQNLGEMDKAHRHLKISQSMEEAKKAGDPLAAELATIQVLLESAQIEQAKERTQAMVHHYPEDWRAPFALGLCLQEEEKYQEALSAFNKARQMEPNEPAPVMSAAEVQSRMGNVMESLGDARKAVHLNPRDPEIRRSLAELLRRHGYTDQAIEEEDLAESLSNPSMN